jgi:hypothetical protein
MSKFAGMTENELNYLPDLPDQALAERGLARQKIRMLCKNTCLNMRSTMPQYEGNHMYTLVCMGCGDVLEENVYTERLFAETDSPFIEET